MRLVIKVGTNLLTAKNGSLDSARMKALVSEIAAVKKAGYKVVLVTSGAIGAGMGKLGWKSRPASLKEKQALAAIGQPLLMHAYHKQFSELGVTIAQVLLTRQDFEDRQRYLNAKNTFSTLLELGVVPIVNENDTVAVEEINIGDNDTLAALVSVKIGARTLVLLTDVDGLYSGLPGKSELIRYVKKVTPAVEKLASGISSSGKGTGGMKTKVLAAKIATSAGVRMVIASGFKKGNIIAAAKGGDVGTTFLPGRSRSAGHKRVLDGLRRRALR
ncbi:MAG TPA: glutamate 5-kinase [Elusimicrobia bacterium]|nr:MAG: glutamate 5-kinase [Elusimicrobia bacterium RIFOXYA12_FULL_49_49]OGS08362.1 MAG: glutamate 5-kinase [Elusimicrobia bacterium RIFOXYA1_FULL_47_7]OGS16599.1 MAG: glutamate 5-kinase [Elusimicrobia bacterium RIFOXYA2_FULL_47_53]OGS25828.1 MAG: glutamate 5-kinase [Elusimicrobia bacterium RIFOXYB12_FULL_50_12]OGS31577.1 MAG: glutamate 5-kinase [Elusimicrobia bacterium RIFOXYB2_FULL_46_23]HBU69022.1 glutamate 5-kinase [Elusimicrobiota bacterium]